MSLTVSARWGPDVEAELHDVPSPINVTTMPYVDYPYNDNIFMNLVNNPEVAAPCRPAAGQLVTQALADPMRVLGERTADELPTSHGDNLGKFLGQTSPSASSQFDPVGHEVMTPFARSSDSTSSSG